MPEQVVKVPRNDRHPLHLIATAGGFFETPSLPIRRGGRAMAFGPAGDG
jgi:hypothetical protein